jgi:glycosyltransferase involved in cell wall biosynthesis
MPRLSVNLCCYNSEPFLRETLDSVFAQTFQDYELVVVNDGSRDGTEGIVREYAAAGRPIRYHAQANAGLGAARNRALGLSSGEIIAIIDHDDVWEPEKMARQMALFERAEVGFVGSDALYIDREGRPLYRAAEVSALRRGAILRELFLYNFIPCASVVMRRSAIAAAGGFFRPDFRIAEEYELFLRLAEASEFDFVADPLVRIRVRRGNSGWDAARERAEMLQAYEECLRRRPGLARDLGERVIRVKSAGFWLRPEEADALNGRGGGLGVRARAYLRYGLSLLGPAAVTRLLRLKRFFTRSRAYLRG